MKTDVIVEGSLEFQPRCIYDVRSHRRSLPGRYSTAKEAQIDALSEETCALALPEYSICHCCISYALLDLL